LVIGSIPSFVGLAVVMPVLGHATWHLYRRTIEPDLNPHPDYPWKIAPTPGGKRQFRPGFGASRR
jgi:hypothetical protein